MSILKRIRRRMMLTCKDVNEFLAAYLDGDVPEDLRRRFEKHVERCRVCRTYLTQYRTTIELTRDSASLDPEPPEALVEMTLEFLREHWNGGEGLRSRAD